MKKIINGIEIETDPQEVLKSNPKWGHRNSGWRPELNVEYIIQRVETNFSLQIGDWEVVVLSNNNQLSSISPNYITSRHWIDNKELYLEGAALKSIEDIKNSIGRKIV
ncbi:MAG TPA: hypothetical protein VJ602_05290, partial [Paludibacter sp.]|nr:hypothetical protein [Paludibacter sp.]